MDLKKFFEFNSQWAIEKTQETAEYFLDLASGQSPKMLYIGCSDSRVTAEAMMGAQPGDVFVHRNIANLVPEGDSSSRSVVNYAVDHLHVEHIVVCGHYGCGGVKAAMGDDDLGVLNPWLQHIKDVYKTHQDELEQIENEQIRYAKFVELNVFKQCQNLAQLPDVQKKIESSVVKIHAWVFDMETGLLRDLNFSVGGSIG